MRIWSFADLHTGKIKDVNYVYKVVCDMIDTEIHLNKTDLVVSCGDFFDRLLKTNDDFVSLAINIMSYLVRACKKTNTKIRLVVGTESHEMSQYRLFNYHLNSKDVDVRVIDTVTEETINGKKILYVPEEYVESKEDHYVRTLYSNARYDYIFGHGVIAEGMPMATFGNKSTNLEKRVPIFKTGELSKASHITCFGHYHVHTRLGGGVYYIGSLFRDSHGEEEPKGYLIIEDDKVSFVENKDAYLYRTYRLSDDAEVYSDVEKLSSLISKIKKENKPIFEGEEFGKIRMLFDLPVNVDPSFKENLRTLLENEKQISILVKEKTTAEQEVESTIEVEYDFILDPSLPIGDKIHRYIGKQYPDFNISLKELTALITEDLKI